MDDSSPFDLLKKRIRDLYFLIILLGFGGLCIYYVAIFVFHLAVAICSIVPALLALYFLFNPLHFALFLFCTLVKILEVFVAPAFGFVFDIPHSDPETLDVPSSNRTHALPPSSHPGAQLPFDGVNWAEENPALFMEELRVARRVDESPGSPGEFWDEETVVGSVALSWAGE